MAPRTARPAEHHGGQQRHALRLTPPTLAVLLAAIVAIAVLSQNLFFPDLNLDLSLVDSSASITNKTFTVPPEEPNQNLTMSSTEQT